MNIRALFAAGAILLAAPAAHANEKLLIGSTSASSSQYGYFVALAKIINDQIEGVEASVVETGATLDNIRRMERNQIDFGLVTTNVVQHAVSGTQGFKGRPTDIQLLWVYAPAPQNVVVRKDSGIDTMDKLNGRRFNPGLKGSATEATAEAVLKTLGIQPDYVRGSTTDVVNMVKDNRVTGYVKSGAGKKLDSSSLDISTMTPINVLSLTDDQASKLEQEMPDISVVKVPANPDQDIPEYSTWSFGLAVAASPNLNEETAYQIVKAAMADKTVQVAALASLKGENLAELTTTYGTVSLHPGAARWFSENGIELPEKLQPKK
ncbi:TAXI family TRAP transporter solute-binding subunit [Stappia taiwanensis]|uniref:TAXI family TRAP transporter solute-binding subunit n=2 Tax=Stappia taiwanensis TaxID=992267 RepID=A0A838XV42_9HYPH|nr:TAXI family TRAP transporter solute-binding subunit [Stappia taiwanensis]GGE98842.1 C4-dicarboxylate ABC transporter substrate-binding protein [Stappia taiwanensis]